MVVLLLVSSQPSGLFSAEEQQEEEEEEERSRLVYSVAEIVEITPESPGEPKEKGSPEAVLREYSKHSQMTPEAMRAMYRAAGGDAKAFKIVKMLIANSDGSGGLDPELIQNREGVDKLKISHTDSVEMAKIRDGWIETVIQDVIKSKSPPWRVARSDSGNMTSGMKSDLDQTFYVEVWDEKEGWIRDPDLDERFIQEFNKTWDNHPELAGVSRDAMDIASFEGRNRFPDPRDVTINFEQEFRRVTEALRRSPGAYTYQGAVVQQMQFRALGEILSGNERAYQVYEMDPETKEMRKLPLDPDAAIRTMFGIEPELLPAHAFGAAMSNLVEIGKKFDVKYHLRPAEDAGVPLAMEGKERQRKIELTELGGDDKEAFKQALDTWTERIVGPMFKDPAKQKLHQTALQISTFLRLIHKNNPGKIPLELPADKAKQEEKIFGLLAEQMFPDFDPANPDPDHIKAAEMEHRKLAKEFNLEMVYHAASEAYRVYRDARYLNPFDMDGYRHLMSGVAPEDWPRVSKNLSQAAHIIFLYAVNDLGFSESLELMKRLHQQFSGERGLKLDLLYLWGRGRGLGDIVGPPLKVAERFNDAFSDQVTKLDAYLRNNAPRLHEKVQQNVLLQLGFEKVKLAETANRVLGDYKLRWSPGSFARNMAYDPGNIDAFAQILRAYVESKGDMARVKAVIADEIIMAVPVAGQIVSASRGGIQGLVFMAGAMAFPLTVGAGLMIYSVGEAGYAIYDLEYGRHVVSNIENAIYQGFAGPATRVYDRAPVQFTEADQAELDRLSAQLDEAKSRLDHAKNPGGGQFSYVPDQDKKIRDAQENSDKLQKELSPKIAQLEMKKRAFEEFRDDSAYGGYFTEWGAITEQRPFKNYLLQEVPPVISFSPAGIVDFRAEFDPLKDEDRIRALEKEIPDIPDAETMLRKMAELKELTLQKARYDRAKRYLAKATGRSQDTANMTEQEAQAGTPELMHKIQRDSLYPGLIELARGQRTEYVDRRREEMPESEAVEEGRVFQPNTDQFADDWLKAHERSAVDELVALGILEHLRNEYGGIIARAEFPDDIAERLKERMESDYQRSRAMYREYLERERVRKENEKILLEQRLAAYRGQSAGLLIEAMDGDPDFKDMTELLTAMGWSAVKRNPPSVKAEVYLIHEPARNGAKPQHVTLDGSAPQGVPKSTSQDTPQGAAQGGPVPETGPNSGTGEPGSGPGQGTATAQDGQESKEHVRVRVHLQITADPNLYRPPYNWDMVMLTKEEAEQAVSSGASSIRGIPLLPETKDALKWVLEEKAPRDETGAGKNLGLGGGTSGGSGTSGSNGAGNTAASGNERGAGSAKGEEGQGPETTFLIPLISVYASDMPDLSKAIPETVRHLPGVDLAPAPEQGTELGYLPYFGRVSASQAPRASSGPAYPSGLAYPPNMASRAIVASQPSTRDGPGFGTALSTGQGEARLSGGAGGASAEALTVADVGPSASRRYLMGQSVAYGNVGRVGKASANLKVFYLVRPKTGPLEYHLEDFDNGKARSFPEYWGDKQVEELQGQVWLRWPEAPETGTFYVELSVTGGSPAYEYIGGHAIGYVYDFPKTEQQKAQEDSASQTDPSSSPVRYLTYGSEGEKRFMVDFPWPAGYVGTFDVKGRVLAYDDSDRSEISDAERRRAAAPLGVLEFDGSFSIEDQRLPDEKELLVRVTVSRESPPKDGQADESKPPTYTHVSFYEKYDESKASSWGDKWGEEKMVGILPQLWIRWKDAPAYKTWFYFDGKVSGGMPEYEQLISIPLERSIELPELGETDQVQAKADAAGVEPDPEQPEPPKYRDEALRKNVLTVPFAWPRGHEGRFTLKGDILVFDKNYYDDSWRKAEPLAKLPVEETFAISSERRESDARLRVKYAKAFPAGTAAPDQYDESGRPLSEATRYFYSNDRQYVAAYDYTDFDETVATPFGYYWEQASVGRGGTPQLWVSWKDVPTDKTLTFELTVRGGTPPYEYTAVGWRIDGLDGFPPYNEKPRQGNSFVINLKYPDGHAGRFTVEGSIYAVESVYSEKEKKYVQQRVPGLELPIRAAFSIRSFPRKAEGTVFLSTGGASGSIEVKNTQPGRRLVQITGAGKTVYAVMDNGRFSFVLPTYIESLESVSLSFKDFGEVAELSVPLKQTKGSPPRPPDPRTLADAQRRIDEYLRTGKTNLAGLASDHSTLARAFMISDSGGRGLPGDYEQWKQHILAQADALRGYIDNLPAPRNDAENQRREKTIIAQRERIASIVWGIAEMALEAGDLAEGRSMFAQAEAELLQSGRAPSSIHYEMSKRYQLLAQKILLLAGDLGAAEETWQKSLEELKAAGVASQQLPESPFQVDPEFSDK